MHSILRKVAAVLTLSAIAFAGHQAAAQQYPNRTVKIVVGYAPGGSTDTAARLIGAALQQELGQPFVVENRPGANAILAHEYVANAAPDGYTLVISSSADTVNVSLTPDIRYDFMKAFIHIARLTQSSFLVVVPKTLPVKGVPDLLEYAKTHSLNFGSSGIGTPSHLGAELMFLTKGIKANHIPYNGAGPLAIAVMSGEIQLGFANMSSSINLAKDGSLHAIGQSTAKRSELAADIPTVAEAGLPGFDVTSWAGFDAPAGTPPAIIKLLQDKALEILARPYFKTQLGKAGAEPYPANTADYTKFLEAEIGTWAKVIKAANVTAPTP